MFTQQGFKAILTYLKVSLPQCVYPEIKDLTKSYQRLFEFLVFLQIWTSPDIAFAVLTLSQFCSAPLSRHYAAARQVLQYLKVQERTIFMITMVA